MNIEELEYSESEFVKSWVESELWFYEFNFKEKNFGGGKHWIICTEDGEILNAFKFDQDVEVEN